MDDSEFEVWIGGIIWRVHRRVTDHNVGPTKAGSVAHTSIGLWIVLWDVVGYIPVFQPELSLPVFNQLSGFVFNFRASQFFSLTIASASA